MLKRILTWILVRLAAIILLVSVALVLPLRYLPAPTSSFMLMHQARVAGARIDFHWVDRAGISREAALAVLAAEDPGFFDHRGFDFAGIRAVLAESLPEAPTRGASTISQQLAKNLYLWPGRSWLRKGLEAWMTVWIELLLPKERILEIYLNVAQFGPATYGVGAASRTYFGKDASELGASEAALLAAVLPGPVRYRVANPSGYVRERQAWIERNAARLSPRFPLLDYALPPAGHRTAGGMPLFSLAQAQVRAEPAPRTPRCLPEACVSRHTPASSRTPAPPPGRGNGQ